MALFDWQDVYSVGIEKMDSQHRKLFEIANAFLAAFERGEPRAALVAIFDELAAHTVRHFTDEERLMRECGYAGFDRHKLSHEKFVARVLGYKRRIESVEPGVEAHAMNVIKTWLNAHLLGMDRDYRDSVMRWEAGKTAAKLA